jgi:hypothetical protein
MRPGLMSGVLKLGRIVLVRSFGIQMWGSTISGSVTTRGIALLPANDGSCHQRDDACSEDPPPESRIEGAVLPNGSNAAAS